MSDGHDQKKVLLSFEAVCTYVLILRTRILTFSSNAWVMYAVIDR